MTIQNADIARVFDEIADLLELGDENPFRVRAYRNAAREVETRSFDIAGRLAKGEELPKMWGVGEELRSRFPPGITQLLTLPGLGAKRVRVLYEKLNVGSLADLQRAAVEGRVRELEGFGAKSEKRILEAVEARLRAGGAAR